MEDKKLNFNHPILSVRRFSSGIASSQKDSRRKNESSHPSLLPSPSYKSEIHSGPLRNAGTVPFVWEQSPGRPKDERKTQKPPIVPKLPPGRILEHKKEDLDITTEGFCVTKSGKDSKKVRSYSRNDDNDNDDGYRENEKPKLTYGPNFLQFNEDDDDDDDEDSEFDYNEHENMSYKVCGLLPHFCLKGSIGLLNPIPGLNVRTRLPISSAKTNRAGSSVNSQAARMATYGHKTLVKHQEDQTVLKNESTEATTHKNSKKLQGSAVYDHLQGYGISNNLTPPCVSERKEMSLQKKGLVSFKELLANEKVNENENLKVKEAGLQNPMIEKTLYVDTVHKVETAKSDLKENDVGILGISHIPTDPPFKPDLFHVKSKHDKEMIIQTDICKDPKVDQKVKVFESDLLAPPPLPKSPSDSWLWRTLPSVSAKTTSLRPNKKISSKTTKNWDKSPYPQGQLTSIPEA